MKRQLFIGMVLAASCAAVSAGIWAVMPAIVSSTALGSNAGVPTTINHQGTVMVNSVRYNGAGQFRFAIVDGATGLNLWTNDGTEVGTSNAPTAAVALAVTDGVYSAALGKAGLMTAIPPAIFANNSNTALRVWFSDGSHGVQQLSPDHPLGSVPYAMSAPDPSLIGEVKLWAGPIANVPSGWLVCDGSAISRTTYANLFQAIGTIHGTGDGSTTFNLPDLRDRLPIGARQDDNGVPKTNVTGALTRSGGQATKSLVTAEMPAHSHSGTTGSGNALAYRVVGAVGTSANFHHFSGYATGNYADHTDTEYPAARHTHNFTTSSAGSGQAFSTMNPYLAMVYIIKY